MSKKRPRKGKRVHFQAWQVEIDGGEHKQQEKCTLKNADARNKTERIIKGLKTTDKVGEGGSRSQSQKKSHQAKNSSRTVRKPWQVKIRIRGSLNRKDNRKAKMKMYMDAQWRVECIRRKLKKKIHVKKKHSSHGEKWVEKGA